MPRLRRKWIGALVALGVVAAATGTAVALTTADPGTYTGCLTIGGNAGGQITAVAEGDTPLKPCSSNQKLIRLGGGDISSITAGTGLTGGGTNGDVTLSLAEAYRLPQNCSAGQVAESGGSNSNWACAADDVGVTDGYSAINTQLTNITTTTLVSKTLPAGSYILMATVDVQNGGLQDNAVTCGGNHSPGFSASERIFLPFDGGMQRATFIGSLSSFAGGAVTLSCSRETNVTTPQAYDARLTAIRVDNLG